jgi:hypothetical protein
VAVDVVVAFLVDGLFVFAPPFCDDGRLRFLVPACGGETVFLGDSGLLLEVVMAVVVVMDDQLWQHPPFRLSFETNL